MILIALVALVVALLTYVRPQTALWSALLGSVVLVSGLRLSSEIPILLGILVGLALRRRSQILSLSWRGFRGYLAALLAFVVVIGLSAFWNAGDLPVAAHGDVLSASRWVMFRLVAVAALGVLSCLHPVQAQRPLAYVAAGLGVLRLVQVVTGFGYPAWLSVFGDLRQPGSANIFAGFLVLALPGAVWYAINSLDEKRGWWKFVLPTAIMIGLGLATSRTALVVLLIEFGVLLCALRTWRRRAVLAGFLAVLFVTVLFCGWTKGIGVVGGANPSLLVVAEESTPDLPNEPAWRSFLWRPDVELRQQVQVPAGLVHPVLNAMIRRGYGSTQVMLHVSVDGKPAAELQTDQIPSDALRWVQIPLPADLLTGKQTVTVSLHATGPLDTARNYVSVAGGGLNGSTYISSFFDGSQQFQTDLSPDAGEQKGTFFLLLKGLAPDGRFDPASQVTASASQSTAGAVSGTPGGGATGAVTSGGSAGSIPTNTDATLKPGDVTTVTYAVRGQVLDNSLHDRILLWQAAWANFLRHPWLGTGYYSFALVQSEYLNGGLFVKYSNPHNMYLQVLSDLGLPGILVFLAILFYPVLHTWRRRSRAPEYWVLLAAAIGVPLFSMMHGWAADVRYYLPAYVLLLSIGVDQGRPKAASDQISTPSAAD